MLCAGNRVNKRNRSKTKRGIIISYLALSNLLRAEQFVLTVRSRSRLQDGNCNWNWNASLIRKTESAANSGLISAFSHAAGCPQWRQNISSSAEPPVTARCSHARAVRKCSSRASVDTEYQRKETSSSAYLSDRLWCSWDIHLPHSFP